jgi:3-methyl-2-oxobutanoate hydroxymethyltransferase
MAYLKDSKPIKLGDIARMHAAGEKIAVLTCYDASFATLLEEAGVDVLLVGDSLGNVVQGHSSTLPVSMEDMIYHTRCVARAARRSFIVTDLPFGSYQENASQAMRSASALLAAGAHMVKLEGGAYIAETIRFLVERGVPVCAHVGLTPQSVHQLGGYRVQGATPSAAAQLKADAIALEQAGAACVVIEMIPADLAGEITRALKKMATIGIGAGPQCSGQVLVLYDMLGIFPGKKPRFTKNFLAESGSVEAAVKAYVAAVKGGSFPAAEHSF